MGGPGVYQQRLCLVRRDMRSACEYAIDLSWMSIIEATWMKQRYRPTCSFPLNTYNLHPSNGFLASGGSWYFKTTFLPSSVLTVFVAAANSPELPKFGFPLSSSLTTSSSPSPRLDFDLERLLLGEGDLDLESLGFREDLDGEADLRDPLLES